MRRLSIFLVILTVAISVIRVYAQSCSDPAGGPAQLCNDDGRLLCEQAPHAPVLSLVSGLKTLDACSTVTLASTDICGQLCVGDGQQVINQVTVTNTTTGTATQSWYGSITSTSSTTGTHSMSATESMTGTVSCNVLGDWQYNDGIRTLTNTVTMTATATGTETITLTTTASSTDDGTGVASGTATVTASNTWTNVSTQTAVMHYSGTCVYPSTVTFTDTGTAYVPVQGYTSTGATTATATQTAICSGTWTYTGTDTATATCATGPTSTITTTAVMTHTHTVTDVDDAVAGTGTTDYIPKWTASGTLGNSQIRDNGTNVRMGAVGTDISSTLEVVVNGEIGASSGNDAVYMWATPGFGTLQAYNFTATTPNDLYFQIYGGNSQIGQVAGSGQTLTVHDNVVSSGNAIVCGAGLSCSGVDGTGTATATASGTGTRRLLSNTPVTIAVTSTITATMTDSIYATAPIYLSEGTSTTWTTSVALSDDPTIHAFTGTSAGTLAVGNDARFTKTYILPNTTKTSTATVTFTQTDLGTATPTPSKIPIADGSGKLDSWVTGFKTQFDSVTWGSGMIVNTGSWQDVSGAAITWTPAEGGAVEIDIGAEFYAYASGTTQCGLGLSFGGAIGPWGWVQPDYTKGTSATARYHGIVTGLTAVSRTAQVVVTAVGANCVIPTSSNAVTMTIKKYSP